MTEFTQEEVDRIAEVLGPVGELLERIKDLIDVAMELERMHAMEAHVHMVDWTIGALHDLHRLLPDPRTTFEASRKAEEPAVASRGRRSGAYAEDRGKRLKEVLDGGLEFMEAVTRWSSNPVANWAELDFGSRKLLGAIYRFDANAYDNWMDGTLVATPKPGTIIIKM